ELLSFLVAPLRALHTRLPNQEMLLVCPLSRLDGQNKEHMQETATLLSQLQEDGTIATALVIDATRSPAAAIVDAATIEKVAVQAMFSLCIASYSDESHPTLSEVVKQL